MRNRVVKNLIVLVIDKLQFYNIFI